MDADNIIQKVAKVIARGKKKFSDPYLEKIYQSITVGNQFR